MSDPESRLNYETLNTITEFAETFCINTNISNRKYTFQLGSGKVFDEFMQRLGKCYDNLRNSYTIPHCIISTLIVYKETHYIYFHRLNSTRFSNVHHAAVAHVCTI